MGESSRTAIAALDAHDGQLLRWQTPPLPGDPRPHVTVLAASGSRLYLGGTFIGSVAAVRLRDSALVPFAPKLDSWDITAIVVSGRTVFIVGTFGGGATPDGQGALVDG